MNLFLKSQILKALDYKLSIQEIQGYQLTETTLHIKKTKRSKHTIDLVGLPGHILIRILNKKIPSPTNMNTGDFFKREIRDLKLKELLVNSKEIYTSVK